MNSVGQKTNQSANAYNTTRKLPIYYAEFYKTNHDCLVCCLNAGNNEKPTANTRPTNMLLVLSVLLNT